ncbi:MAG TPA: type II toxin-antitoxin system HicA family toxin [Candidatus Binatia bacterium]|jgi:predicted RNA binding protein YcfA (HicA-like mRNA interferase family)
MPKITPVPYQTLVRVFEKDGFQLQRTHGDHLVYTKPGIPRPIVIPMYDQVPVFIIRNNLRSARMSRERYFELLGTI